MQRELDQIDSEVQSITRALSQTPDGDPKIPLLLRCLANAHHKRFNLRHEPDDIHKVIECRSIALTLTPNDDSDLPDMLSDLAMAHSECFKHLGDKNDMEKAIECQSSAVELIPEGDTDLPRQLSNLAMALKDRFKHLGEAEDIKRAIQCDSRAVAITPKDHPSLSIWLEKLGLSHGYRFQRFGELHDLESAIEHGSRALNLIPDGHPQLSSRLCSLAVFHKHRFRRLGKLSDLEQAIQYESRALELISDDHSDFSICLANLAVSHIDRFRRLGDMGALKQAMEYQSRVLALTPDGHPHLPGHLANLAVSHSYRFRRLGDLGDLDHAIKYESRALALIPADHPDLSRHFANLAVSYRHRFQRLGELSDLEQAINHESRALTLTPDGHPKLSGRLANLAVSHADRFGRLGELSDLEQAIKYESRALALTPDGHPDLSIRLANLSLSYKDRFGRLGELSDLEQAIEYASRALALIPDGHSDVSIHLANLAVYHTYRFQQLGELGDLEQAMKYESRALNLTPSDHSDLSIRLANIAVTYKHRFECLGELSDLEQVIDYESRALAAVTHDHPRSCFWHFNHATSYVLYYNHTDDPSHLQQALHLFRTAATSLTGSPRDRFRHAHLWALYASKYSALSPIEAYQATIDLLPQFIWLGATADQRYQDLKSVQTLAVDAAHAAIVSSNYPLALEWLEHTRCVVWNQNLMLRSPIDLLLASHPALATQLQTVANELHAAGSNSRDSQALSRSMSSEQVAQEHRRLAKEYEDLLAKARIQLGFEDFLRPIKANRLTQATRNGAIAVIICHPDQCDALIVRPQQANVTHVQLPNFNSDKARDARLKLQMSVESLRLPERGIELRHVVPPEADQDPSEFESLLAVLWYNVAKPVLDHLGYMNNVTTDSLPHITWCPTGAMTFLPLHAAGDYDQPHSRVFDYAISSYTPTLTALLESASSSLTSDSRVLAVGQATTPGHAALPGAALELNYLKAHMQGQVKYTQLLNEQATVAAVLCEMKRHDWVHLACHAHQNVDDPKKSGFFLPDGVLDIDEINRCSLKGKGLAFLSACQTATGDKALADEAVHLASGMLMAGYASVIATMWSVGDAEAPFVADKVYSELMKKGTLGNGEVGRALHDAVEGLRAKVGEKEFGSWVPFIHIGS